MSEKSTGKTVYFTPNRANPPELTKEQEERLDAMRDEDIDLSDIPSQAGKLGWHPTLYGENIDAIRRTALKDGLLVVDDDVLAFFKERGGPVEEQVNAVLREYAEAQRKRA